MWCWRRMQGISWIDPIKNVEYYMELMMKEHLTYNKTEED